MTPVVLRLREVRQSRGITQTQLAATVGVRRATISDLETGKTRTETLDLIDRLCHALTCEPAELLVRTAPRRKKRA
jgi:putative transcriptional regulator